MNQENIVKKTVGRPVKIVVWPDTEFTVGELSLQLGFCKALISSKIKSALSSGVLKVSGKRPNSKGRATVIYRKVVNIISPENVTLLS